MFRTSTRFYQEPVAFALRSTAMETHLAIDGATTDEPSSFWGDAAHFWGKNADLVVDVGTDAVRDLRACCDGLRRYHISCA